MFVAISLTKTWDSLTLIYKALCNYTTYGTGFEDHKNYPMRNILLHADFCKGREMRYAHQNERSCRTVIELYL